MSAQHLAPAEPRGRDDEVLRVGVIGGGLVAQTVHLPYLVELSEHFELRALVDPSPAVRDLVGRRYGIPATYGDHEAMFEGRALDAVVICSPNGTHADAVNAALDAGVHVLVEKPLCITLADADRIIQRTHHTGLVVQVAYMKRFDPAFEALLEDLPLAGSLRYISTVTYDPGLASYFAPADIVMATDVPEASAAAARERTIEQVAESIGSEDPDDVAVFSEVFLGALVHDVNLVHAALRSVDVDAPGRVVSASCSGKPQVASGVIDLSEGLRWALAWLHLPGLHDFREEVGIYAEGAVHALSFPAPYIRQAPTAYRRTMGTDDAAEVREVRSYRESYARQLLHFHAAITRSGPVRTPPAEARLDIELLTEMFRACRAARSEGSSRLLARS